MKIKYNSNIEYYDDDGDDNNNNDDRKRRKKGIWCPNFGDQS